jgi:hypothetical protein
VRAPPSQEFAELRQLIGAGDVIRLGNEFNARLARGSAEQEFCLEAWRFEASTLKIFSGPSDEAPNRPRVIAWGMVGARIH